MGCCFDETRDLRELQSHFLSIHTLGPAGKSFTRLAGDMSPASLMPNTRYRYYPWLALYLSMTLAMPLLYAW